MTERTKKYIELNNEKERLQDFRNNLLSEKVTEVDTRQKRLYSSYIPTQDILTKYIDEALSELIDTIAKKMEEI